MTPLDAAIHYVDLGFAVFPCAPGQKYPLTEHGLLDATTDHEQINRWWSKNPNANIAIRTDGLLVVDVDGEDDSWLGDQDERWEDLARAPSSRTPRGGRHFWFRQPAGNAWRCTQGRLAERVDTRANGGYIVAPPSLVDGRAYRWLEGYELDVSPDQLPEPPAWLVEQLDRIATKPAPVPATGDQMDKITEGRRNGVLTSFAGSMRRVGMTKVEIAAALHQINTDRCVPPLETVEVDRIAVSIAGYAPDQIATAVAEGRLEELAENQLAHPLSVRDLVSKYPVLREPVIHGLIRHGETMNVISVPKLGKSWLVLDLALAVATGRMWLETFQTERGDVLILDNELHGETSAHRIPKVAEVRDIPYEAFADRLFVLNLRGKLKDVFSLRPFFESVEPGQFKVIILDAFYRFMPRDMDENDNGTMANLYSHLDLYANRLGCCFVLIHHTTKGNQSAKSVTDVGAGAGSQSRATDTHLVLRPHEESDAVVLDAAVRSWPPVTPIVLRWTFPVWTPAGDLDPSRLRGEKRKVNSDAQADWTAAMFVEAFVTENASPRDAILGCAREAGLSTWRATCLLREAEARELIYRHGKSRNRPSGYSTQPPESEGDEA